MARSYIHEQPSPYYPPRARWYSAVFYLGNALRRRLALDRPNLPRDIRIGELVVSLFVPGLAVWLRGPKLWGQAALAGGALLLFTFVVWLGYPVANFAFGLLLSLHVTGFVYYCKPLIAGEPFRLRLSFTFLVLLAFGLMLYLPARHFVQDHCVTPLRMNNQVIVVQRLFQPHQLQRGEWLAYTFDEDATGRNYHGGTVVLRNGISLGPVLGLPGDQVMFSTNGFSINGVLHTNLLYMPVGGEFTVSENHWFIWPNLDISGHGNVGEARISSALMGLSNVNESQFYGKPLRHWFWRKQILP